MIIKFIKHFVLLDSRVLLTLGMVYSFFLMRTYVSFRHDVSNGGFPTSSVYLQSETRSESENGCLNGRSVFRNRER